MDVTLQRHCARYIYVVPEGLHELLTDISREVLRTQPLDMYTFIADYLDALLITRENARVAAKFVEDMTEASETIVDLLKRTGMSREDVNKTADVIQDAFKAWSERKGILKEDEEVVVTRIIEDAGISEVQVQEAAVAIQNAFKAFKLKQERESQLLSGIIDWRVAARSAILLYRKSGASPEEAKKAANLIKAAYKGYYTRRAIRQLNEPPEEEEEEKSEDIESLEAEDASWSGRLSGERKSKGVRIDFATVVPHVDFGDEELIGREKPHDVEEEEEEQPDADIMKQIFGEEEKEETEEDRDAEFMRRMVLDVMNRVVGAVTEEKPELGPIEEKDSEVDVFVPAPTEEEEPLYNRPLSLPHSSQDQLDEELEEAKQLLQKTHGITSSRQSKAEAAEHGEKDSAESLPGSVHSKTKEKGTIKAAAKTLEAGPDTQAKKTVEKVAEDAITKAAKGTVAKAAKETVAKEAKETVAEEAQETVAKGAKETVAEAVNETVAEGAKETVAEAAKETVAEAAKETVAGAKKTVAEGAEEITPETTKETTAATAEETVAKTAKEAVAEGTEELTPATTKETTATTAVKTVAEPAEKSVVEAPQGTDTNHEVPTEPLAEKTEPVEVETQKKEEPQQGEKTDLKE